MATFNFPYHRVATKYPESSFTVQLGNSYQFSAPPPAPDQRIFNLFFPLMKWFVGPTNQLDKTREPEINLALLDDFYNIHKRNLTFTYNHPVYGPLSCRFNQALKIPAGTPGANGAVENIEVELIEVPGLSPSSASSLVQVSYNPIVF